MCALSQNKDRMITSRQLVNRKAVLRLGKILVLCNIKTMYSPCLLYTSDAADEERLV